MLLPKPNVLTVPTYAAPIGIGLGACNSGNSCEGQSCDINKEEKAEDCGSGLTWTIVGTVATVVGASASAAG